MDQIFELIDESIEMDSAVGHFNQFHEAIGFTPEVKDSFHFLGMGLTWHSDGRLRHAIYLKPTWTK